MKRILIAILLFILVAFVVTMILSYRTFKKSLPQTNGTIEIQALNDKVQIYRDEYGIPHIFAQNDHVSLSLSFRGHSVITANRQVFFGTNQSVLLNFSGSGPLKFIHIFNIARHLKFCDAL